jgi:hypothetical protein
MSPQHFALVWQVASTQTHWLHYVVELTFHPIEPMELEKFAYRVCNPDSAHGRQFLDEKVD